MEHIWARDGHLRRRLAVRFEEAEVLEHRMGGRKAQRSDNVRRLGLGLHALELDARLYLAQFDAIEQAVEIEMPPGAAKLAVSGELKPDRFLLGDDFFDLAVFDLFERGRVDLAFFAFD